jgi:hypothetical protein
MCNASLHTTQNRLAEEGEDLILHRFQSGTLKFVSAFDRTKLEHAAARGETAGFWSSLKHRIRNQRPLRRVLIPPGSRLLLVDIPQSLRTSPSWGTSAVVVFIEIVERSNSYRDGVVFPQGARVPLQDLPEGLHALVLSTSAQESTGRDHAEASAA